MGLSSKAGEIISKIAQEPAKPHVHVALRASHLQLEPPCVSMHA